MIPEKLTHPWLTFGLRLSVFPATIWDAPLDLWERVVGTRHETDASQVTQHIRTQAGPWHQGTLQLTTLPSKIDWIAAPGATAERLPDVDKWPIVDIMPAFLSVTRSWLTDADFDIIRIGFGVTALLSAPDKAAAYKLLQGLVASVKIDPEATSDLFYQINRPVQSKVLGNQLRLNRLMKWHSASFALAHMQVSPTEITQAGPVLAKYYASFDVDINTPAENRRALEKSLIGAIYDELVELAWDNLERGEMG
jgi:hypothetical protein